MWKKAALGSFLAVLVLLVVLGTRQRFTALMEAGYDGVLDPASMSGPVRAGLPWQEDPRFLQAREKNGSLYLLAAFKTVLPDPLPGEEYNVELAARLLAGTVLQPGEIFSQNRKLGPYVASRGYRKGPTYMGTRVVTTEGGGVCKIATTLYNVVRLADLEVVERHPHGMTVPYVPAGQDATVSYGNRDFRFRNNSPSPVLIWSYAANNTLHIGFYGRYTPPDVTWRHQLLARVEPPVLDQYDASLPAGTEQVILAGADGITVRSWLVIKSPDGSVKTRQLGVDRYQPMPRIIRRGTGNGR